MGFCCVSINWHWPVSLSHWGQYDNLKINILMVTQYCRGFCYKVYTILTIVYDISYWAWCDISHLCMCVACLSGSYFWHVSWSIIYDVSCRKRSLESKIDFKINSIFQLFTRTKFLQIKTWKVYTWSEGYEFNTCLFTVFVLFQKWMYFIFDECTCD